MFLKAAVNVIQDNQVNLRLTYKKELKFVGEKIMSTYSLVVHYKVSIYQGNLTRY